MSLIIAAPDSSATRATSARRVSIEIGTRSRFPNRASTGVTRASSTSTETLYRTDRTRRLSADVDHVGARRFHRERMLDGAVRVEVSAAVGERVGRHVEHAHHGGKLDYAAVGQLEICKRQSRATAYDRRDR